MHVTRTPDRAAEPTTLDGKLEAREREHAAEYDWWDMLVDLGDETAAVLHWPKVELARRRVQWARKRHEEATNEVVDIQLAINAISWRGLRFGEDLPKLQARAAVLRAKLHG